MNFLNPFFLLGALAVAVPVVIHLINLRRPQKVSFSTLAFFEELQKSTIRKIRIKQYILLALRVLAVLMLALALARPLLTPTLGGAAADSNQPKLAVLLVDNSPSMSRIGADGPFFDQARQVAQRIVESSKSSDRFIVTGTNSSEQGLQMVNAARALDLLEEVEIANTGNHINQTIQMVANQLKNSSMQNGVIYLLTDGQKSQLDNLRELEEIGLEGTRQLGLQVITLGSSSQPNIAVSDVQLQSRMLSQGNPVALQVEIQNYGDAGAANQFVSLEVEGNMVGQYEVNLEPGETRQLGFEIVPQKVGDISGKIVIEGDEISFDNERFFVINIPQTRTVLLVNEIEEEGSEFVSYLQPALEAARLSNTQIEFNQQESGEVDQSNWMQNDVIILDGLREVPEYWYEDLQRYVQNGKGLLFFPSEQGNIENYNSFLGLFNAGRLAGIRGEYASFKPVARIADLQEGHPILDGIFEKEEDEDIRVDLPELFFYYQFEQASSTGSYTILSSTTDEEILVEQRFGDGRMLVSTLGTDPGWSNFPVNALFAPIYYRSVLYASSSEQGGLNNYQLGSEFVWNGRVETQSIELSLDSVTYKPEVQNIPNGTSVRYSGREWEPGILHIEAGDQRRLVAVNQDISESDFQSFTQEELENFSDIPVTITNVLNKNELSQENLVTELQSASMGREIWSWFIWIALALLIAETLISKLYRAESIT
ncbi:BatA domain-containing protein [Aliifodinibius sp. S!AR15-10]|uniref:BatA domain-containing protein n=1 Tax=Aliifodinibius sp. S!AR15-10 TaxID=2950437 RepID=UPI00285AF93A|nr:BatA domain-containing protein [Aliifodinibius sp. S!AR15-10]MDR8393101.1 BatA domain-containing protein [Aliifodinibius sp. S!AR15-10]